MNPNEVEARESNTMPPHTSRNTPTIRALHKSNINYEVGLQRSRLSYESSVKKEEEEEEEDEDEEEEEDVPLRHL